MAGTSWPTIVDGRKRRASEVEAKFDFLEGALVPMNNGNPTDAVYDLGSTSTRWNNIYFAKGMMPDSSWTAPSYSFVANSACGFYLHGTNEMRFASGVLQAGSVPSYPLTFTLNNAANVAIAMFRTPSEDPGISFNSMTGCGFSGNVDPRVEVCFPQTTTGATLHPIVQFFDYNIPAASLGTICYPNDPGVTNLGTASQYWNEINYKVLTDRGCLGWFDLGVEMPDGKVVSDLESICAIQRHPSKNTVYGIPMLDYKSFPSVAYKRAAKRVKDARTGKRVDVELPRDENDEPYEMRAGKRIPAADGIEMTSMFSIMLGALREIERRIVKLEEHYGLR